MSIVLLGKICVMYFAGQGRVVLFGDYAVYEFVAQHGEVVDQDAAGTETYVPT